MKFLTDTAVCLNFRSNYHHPYIGRHLAEWMMEVKALLINDLKSFRWALIYSNMSDGIFNILSVALYDLIFRFVKES